MCMHLCTENLVTEANTFNEIYTAENVRVQLVVSKIAHYLAKISNNFLSILDYASRFRNPVNVGKFFQASNDT